MRLIFKDGVGICEYKASTFGEELPESIYNVFSDS